MNVPQFFYIQAGGLAAGSSQAGAGPADASRGWSHGVPILMSSCAGHELCRCLLVKFWLLDPQYGAYLQDFVDRL